VVHMMETMTTRSSSSGTSIKGILSKRLCREALYRIADIKAQVSSRLSCLEYCQIVMDSYPSEEKWRNWRPNSRNR
jgi:hypothetical protein